ncbi:hypothetical protein [Novispirillum itersonii]|uniref:Uncharacterized protein n=1 Tax=Novispirillum itersonii TaxID=189 RepID=A0A7W9ZI03_NOVIT|nr:hypothetical protein [Novispirillum itersonii]MBB6211565.1 hypothetical protein [Novispirillum itersonii]
MADRHARQNPDAQAQTVISAMHDAARRFRRRRDHMLSSPAIDRPRLTDELIADIDRLANLMALLQSTADTPITPETRVRIAGEVERVRRYVTRVGLDVALDRIREIRATAEAHCAQAAHPLGKSVALREGFMRYVTYLGTLAAGLSDQHLNDLRASAEGINRLTSRDRESPWLRSFSNETTDVEVIADIDLFALEMDILSRLARDEGGGADPAEEMAAPAEEAAVSSETVVTAAPSSQPEDHGADAPASPAKTAAKAAEQAGEEAELAGMGFPYRSG